MVRIFDLLKEEMPTWLNDRPIRIFMENNTYWFSWKNESFK